MNMASMDDKQIAKSGAKLFRGKGVLAIPASHKSLLSELTIFIGIDQTLLSSDTQRSSHLANNF